MCLEQSQGGKEEHHDDYTSIVLTIDHVCDSFSGGNLVSLLSALPIKYLKIITRQIVPSVYHMYTQDPDANNSADQLSLTSMLHLVP